MSDIRAIVSAALNQRRPDFHVYMQEWRLVSEAALVMLQALGLVDAPGEWSAVPAPLQEVGVALVHVLAAPPDSDTAVGMLQYREDDGEEWVRWHAA